MKIIGEWWDNRYGTICTRAEEVEKGGCSCTGGSIGRVWNGIGMGYPDGRRGEGGVGGVRKDVFEKLEAGVDPIIRI
jgi:hypothetical protein